MRLDTYFRQHSQYRLSDSEKIRIYQRILSKRSGSSERNLKRASLAKKTIYSFLALWLVFFFFGTFFFNTQQRQDYRAFWTEKLPHFNTASAGEIGKILNINGDYIIEKEGKQFKNSVLFDGDIILLKPNAKILFNISTDTKIEVKGPAQLRITKRTQWWYHLNLMEGEYLTISAKSSNDIIELETAHINIETTKDTEINFELTNNNQKVQLKNSWAPLLVKNKKHKEELGTQLAQAKILTIQENDISKIEDINSFKTLLTKNNITHTSKLEDTNIDTTDQNDLQELKALLSDEKNTQTLKSEELTQINHQLEYQNDQKSIPTEEQVSHINAALNKNFLLSDLKQLFIAKSTQNKDLEQQTYFILNEKIKNIGNKYTISITQDWWADTLNKNIDTLKEGLQKYHLPPNKTKQLSILKNWINFLQKENNLNQDWDKLISELPTNLIFN